jgi:hypothetical protein
MTISGWEEARLQIIEGVRFLCRGKTGVERAETVEKILDLVRQIARGNAPEISTPLIGHKDEHYREVWARRIADRLVGMVMLTAERYEAPELNAALREIAKLSLWHMPNALEEVKRIKAWIELERLRQPHPMDEPPKR